MLACFSPDFLACDLMLACLSVCHPLELSRISDMSVSDDCRPRARRHFASDDCLHAPLATQVVTSTPIHSKASSELAVKASGDAADGRMLYDQGTCTVFQAWHHVNCANRSDANAFP